MGGLWGKGDTPLICLGFILFAPVVWYVLTLPDPPDAQKYWLPWYVHAICSSIVIKVLTLEAIFMMFLGCFRLIFVIQARKPELEKLQALQEAVKSECRDQIAPETGGPKPMITVIMPVKFACLKCSNPEEMWHSQLMTAYSGKVEYIFVVESMQDKVVGIIETVRKSKPHLQLQIVEAGLTTSTSQKIHNMLAGVRASNPESKYIMFLDAAIETHLATFGNSIESLESNPNSFVCGGFPVDVPPAGASIWSWAICQFRWTSSLASFNSDRFKGVWGGFMVLRRNSLLNDDVWQDHSFGDDVLVMGAAEDGAGIIVSPMSNLFPNIMKKDISLATCFDFLRRQGKMLRSYHTRGMCCRNTLLSLFGFYSSFGISVSVPIGFLAILCAAIFPDTMRVYPAAVYLSMLWVANVVGHAYMERKMLLSALAICQAQTPKSVDTSHLTIAMFIVSLWAQMAVSVVTYALSYVYPYLTWGGITYKLSWGKIVSIKHPEPAVPVAALDENLSQDPCEEDMPGTPTRNRLLLGVQLFAVVMVLLAFNADRTRPIPATPTYASSWPLLEQGAHLFSESKPQEGESVLPFVFEGASQKKSCMVVGGVSRSVQVPEIQKVVTLESMQVFEIPVPIHPGTTVSWTWHLEGAENDPLPAFSVLMYDSVKKAVRAVSVVGTFEGNFTGTKSDNGVLSLSWKNNHGYEQEGGKAIRVAYTVKVLQETNPLEASDQLRNYPIFVVSLPHSVRRKATLTERMASHRLKFQFEDGVDGDQLEKKNKGEFKLQDRDITVKVKEKKIPNGMKSKLSPAISKHEVAVTVSHLKTIRAAYLAGVPQALITEDDLSLEYLPQWKDKGIDPVLDALECGSERHQSWSVVQMAITVGFLKSSLGRKLEERLYIGESVTLRDPVRDYELWSATAYLIHRRGMEYLLDRHWPGGLKAIQTPWEELKGTFDFTQCLSGLADTVVYSAPNTFVVNRPLFSSDDDGVSSLDTRDDSFIFNFNPDYPSKHFVTEKFYPETDRTFHGDRLASCQMDLGFLPWILPQFICESYLWLRSALELLVVLVLLIPTQVRQLLFFCKNAVQQSLVYLFFRCRQGISKTSKQT